MRPIQPAARIAGLVRDVACELCGTNLRVEDGEIIEHAG